MTSLNIGLVSHHKYQGAKERNRKHFGYTATDDVTFLKLGKQ